MRQTRRSLMAAALSIRYQCPNKGDTSWQKRKSAGAFSHRQYRAQEGHPGDHEVATHEVVAVASRDVGKAEDYIAELGLTGKAKAHGSYEELFADPNVDAIYNPLPNHLHVPMTLAAAKAGKHVLCEKPIALNASEAEQLRQIPNGHRLPRSLHGPLHPQWQRARDIARSGELGELRAVRGSLRPTTYTDPANVRNQADIGGGGHHGYRLLPDHRLPLPVRAPSRSASFRWSTATRMMKTDRLASRHARLR